MHGKRELDEQMTQICIQENYKDKYIEYLTCFLSGTSGSAEESAACVAEMGFDQSVLDACIDDLDEEYNVTGMYNDKSTWLSGNFPQFNVYKDLTTLYEVRGSPSFVINEQSISTGRSPAALLSTICSGFENPPEECNQEISTETPGPGFGMEGTGSATAATCG